MVIPQYSVNHIGEILRIYKIRNDITKFLTTISEFDERNFRAKAAKKEQNAKNKKLFCEFFGLLKKYVSKQTKNGREC